MRIGFLGAGTWGFCLASLLGSKGYTVVTWSREKDLISQLQNSREHPKLEGYHAPSDVIFTDDISTALDGVDMIVESVTAQGVRPVFESLKELGLPKVPIVSTSKGIEQKTGLLMTEVLLDVLGEEYKPFIGCLSGPSHAEEVVRQIPTSVVAAAYAVETRDAICRAFTTDRFRVYPNNDVIGVEFGGAMKNIIAIACGISDGLGFGDNTKAALITRGLHEIRKLAVKRGADSSTLNGLAGMGDLCVTCLSTLSRNYRFGSFLSTGISVEEAQKQVGAVVEGCYSCLSAIELGKHYSLSLPITEGVYSIVYEGRPPQEVVELLMSRAVKEEQL